MPPNQRIIESFEFVGGRDAIMKGRICYVVPFNSTSPPSSSTYYSTSIIIDPATMPLNWIVRCHSAMIWVAIAMQAKPPMRKRLSASKASESSTKTKLTTIISHKPIRGRGFVIKRRCYHVGEDSHCDRFHRSIHRPARAMEERPCLVPNTVRNRCAATERLVVDVPDHVRRQILSMSSPCHEETETCSRFRHGWAGI